MNPIHVTANSIDKAYLPVPMPQAWTDVTERLNFCNRKLGLSIHACVLMGNHFHLLCHPRWSTIEESLNSFFITSESKMNLWNTSYNWSEISSHRHYAQVYRYIYQNPLRANLVSRVEDYPFSTLHRDLPFPLHSSLSMSFCGEEGEKIWLNQRYDQDEETSIRMGLKKKCFQCHK